MAERTSFQKNYPKFEAFMRDVCKLHKIRILKKDSKAGYPIGYFYVDKGQAVMEIPTYVDEEAFVIIAHEFGHAMQYIKKDENLVGKFQGKHVTEIMHDWFDGKEFPPEFIFEMKQRMKQLEIVAEEKLIEFNRLFKLGLSEKTLWKYAYAYIYEIEYLYQNRTNDLQVYHLKRSILGKMPDNAKAKSHVLVDSSPEIMYLIKQEHEKVLKTAQSSSA